MTSSLRMPAGEKKYLLVEKRRLIFTSSSVVVPSCCSSIIDDRWYNVPRRPFTGLSPVLVLPPLVLIVATPDDATFAAADILKMFVEKDKVMKRFCLSVLAVSIFMRTKLIQIFIFDFLFFRRSGLGDSFRSTITIYGLPPKYYGGARTYSHITVTSAPKSEPPLNINRSLVNKQQRENTI